MTAVASCNGGLAKGTTAVASCKGSVAKGTTVVASCKSGAAKGTTAVASCNGGVAKRTTAVASCKSGLAKGTTAVASCKSGLAKRMTALASCNGGVAKGTTACASCKCGLGLVKCSGAGEPGIESVRDLVHAFFPWRFMPFMCLAAGFAKSAHLRLASAPNSATLPCFSPVIGLPIGRPGRKEANGNRGVFSPELI